LIVNNRLFSWNVLPLWVGFALILIPFFSIWRVGMLSSFYLEAGSLLFALIFVLMSVVMFWGNASGFSGSLKQNCPPASIYFIVLAIFWAMQARIMKLPYIGLSDMVAWTFVVYALVGWACRGWVLRVGQERVVSILAWVLVLGACLQGVVAWLQYSGKAAAFSGYLMYRPNIVEGQLGQYNHLGHFMMWGILSAGYLWGVKRMAVWLFVPIIVYLTATTGIITSRALIAYVLAMAILLPIWRVLAGKSANRVVMGLALAAAGVIVFQFALEPILQIFSDAPTHLDNGIARLGEHSHEGSGRSYEWKKAWAVFQTAPMWGYGWGSYPVQSFLLDEHIYPKAFRLYDPNVLFTHSHNSFLNLLAEMGLVGTLLILGGLAWVISGCLKMRNAPNLLLLALMTVSLTHSFLEYPLWYIYFLTVFALFPMLMTTGLPNVSEFVSGSLKNCLSNNKWAISVALLALAMIFGITRLGFAYNELVAANKKNNTTSERTQEIMQLLHTSRTEPMLAHYADITLINYTQTNSETLPQWANLAQKSIGFRPYAHAYKNGLILYRQGKVAEAKHWLHQTYRYYPHQMHVYGNEIMLSPYYTGLRQQFTEECEAYRHADPKKAPICAEALPSEPKIKKTK